MTKKEKPRSLAKSGLDGLEGGLLGREGAAALARQTRVDRVNDLSARKAHT